MSSRQRLANAMVAVDHLLLGMADLETGIEWFERTTGVKAGIGGVHPGAGTRNALVSLGGKQYLELIAPDPAQSAYNFHIDVRKLAEPRLITWAAATTDINSVAKKARDAGRQVFGPREGARTKPDGRVLRWKSLAVVNELGDGAVQPVPFFIEWSADSLHPSKDSPGGCRLQSFEMEHPDPLKLTGALKDIGIEASVKRARSTRLRATLSTPKGNVELS